MFDYKEASFYTDYFSNNNRFRIIDEFREDEKEKNIYVGKLEVLNTINPLFLTVEIPKTFPHAKLTFWTDSLFGYPHLIASDSNEGFSWFCLNTPFAETAENQLEQEIYRLEGWIHHWMKEDLNLPPIIEDPNVRKALLVASSNGRLNPDEVAEIRQDARLTFFGDKYNKAESFKNIFGRFVNMGYFLCEKNGSNRIFVRSLHLNSLFRGNAKPENKFFNLPFLILDDFKADSLSDFLKLRETYELDENTCKHLLPFQEVTGEFVHFPNSKSMRLTDLSEVEALKSLADFEEKLKNDNSAFEYKSYLWHGYGGKPNGRGSRTLTQRERELLSEWIENTRYEVLKNHGLHSDPWHDSPDITKMTPEERKEYEENQDYIEYLIEKDMIEFSYFCLGFKEEEKINWILCYTNKASIGLEKIDYDCGIKKIEIEKSVSCPLSCQLPFYVNKIDYFGRGSLSKGFDEMKIGIVGAGAIGSMVAVSLAKGGIDISRIWDDDIVEPGNICRSAYSMADCGESKVDALKDKVIEINPFESKLYVSGWYRSMIPGGNNFNGPNKYINGSFYGNVNYNDQEDAIKYIEDFDLLIDCTGSNEMLHFLSYAVPKAKIISLCITNHSNDLVCVTSRDGNPFELRKAYLSAIEQDTKNFFYEGSGCYSPTFLAKNCDIASLVNLAIREMDNCMQNNELMHSIIWSHDKRGVLANRMKSYRLNDYDIRMTVCTETIYDAEEMNDARDGRIGYLLGSYSRDGLLIMVTHVVDACCAEEALSEAFKTSQGIIDYIGDFTYSGADFGTYQQSSLELLASKAADETINTCNPMLATRNPDGSLSFFLYINHTLVPFVEEVN